MVKSAVESEAGSAPRGRIERRSGALPMGVCYAALSALTFTACLDPARQRAEKDEHVGQAGTDALELSVEGGLAAVRQLDAERLVIWQSAPRIEMHFRALAAGALELELLNTMPEGRLVHTQGIDVTLQPWQSEVPTRARYRIAWEREGSFRLAAEPRATSVAPFRFALMSDVQEAIDEVRDIYARVNATPDVEFLLGAGDLTRRGSHSELARFERELEHLDVPYYTTLGNHELGVQPPPFQDRMGRASFTFEHRGVRFTLLDSASATIDPLVLSNLEGWLELGREQLHIVGMHIPPVDPVGVRNGSFASRNEANALFARLIRGEVDLTLYGHIHSYYRFENAGIPARISGGGGAIPERFDEMGRHFLSIDVDPLAQAFESKVVRVD